MSEKLETKFEEMYAFKGATRDEDPVLAKNRIQGSVPQTKIDF